MTCERNRQDERTYLFFDDQHPSQVFADFEPRDFLSGWDEGALYLDVSTAGSLRSGTLTSAALPHTTPPWRMCIVRPIPQNRPFDDARYNGS